MKQRCLTEFSITSIYKISLLIILISSFFCANVFANDIIEVKKLFKISGSGNRSLKQPSNMTVDNQGTIYILNDLRERIMVYNRNGDFQFSIRSDAEKNINIYKAYSLTTDDYNNIHLYDPYELAIHIFNDKGTYQKSLPMKFDDELEHKITELSFSYGNYFMIDNSNNYLYIFETNGRINKRSGKKGELSGEFNHPFSMAFGADGRIYVTDVLNSRVQVFTTTGTFLSQISDFGFTDGNIFRPNGIAVDRYNNVFVSDSLLGIVNVFKADGTFVAPLMKDGNVAKFKTPSRIKVFEDRIYILETLNNSVDVYQLQY